MFEYHPKCLIYILTVFTNFRLIDTEMRLFLLFSNTVVFCFRKKINILYAEIQLLLLS